MNSISRCFGGETDPMKKFTGKIIKSTIILDKKGQFHIGIQNGKYEDIVKSKYTMIRSLE